MGFLESMALLLALGGGAYVTVYYVLPALQQMAIAPYYYMQAQQQQQQPAAPAQQEPLIQDATLADEAIPELTSTEDTTNIEDPPLDELVEDAVGDELEDAGLVSDPPEEEKDKKKSSSKSDYDKQKKRHDRTVKKMNPKKDSRYKGMTSKQAGAAAKKKLLGRYTEVNLYSYGIKHMLVDEADIVRDQYYE